MVNSYLENYVVFDLETTGCNPVKDYIIEIGALKIVNGKIHSSFNELINPGIAIPNYITAITGITDGMVKGKPFIDEVLQDFLAFCQEDYILGHNILFDFKFIKAKCHQKGYAFNKKALDTLEISRKHLRQLPSRSLGALCQYYGIELSHAHRAVHDAFATHQLFQCLKRDFLAMSPSSFEPKEMVWTPPKMEMITDKQKKYLQSLLRTYKINLNREVESLTKSEASRVIDHILSEYRYK